MTENVIIKALECCLSHKCNNCPLVKQAYCQSNLQEDALIHIKNQNTIINQLYKTLDDKIQEKDRLIKTYAELQIANIDSFTKRLRETILSDSTDDGQTSVFNVVDTIDNLKKEWVGGKNA